MCGILLAFGDERGEKEVSANDCALRDVISRRGPDFCSEVSFPNHHQLRFMFASCLFMRERAAATRQPLSNGDFVLCFNGELYDKHVGASDTQFVFNGLIALADNASRVDFLSSLEGEWALAFYNVKERILLFGRDALGRRSLLVAHEKRTLRLRYLASTAIPDPNLIWRELPASSMFQSSDQQQHHVYSIECLPRFPQIARPCVDAGGLPTWARFLAALEHAMRARLALHTLPMSAGAAILFSGGIDSVLLAACAHRVLDDEREVIHLINVSFQGEEAPDRIACLLALAELERAFPQRRFHLLKVDVELAEVQSDERDIYAHMLPKTTVMDFNLACVLWFASKHASSSQQLGGIRALLSGIGADELCGGYTRHKRVFERLGLQALRAELAMDVNRLWERNFGRDDRVVAAFGRELRMPFVDAQVLQVVQTSPIEDLMSFDGANTSSSSPSLGVGDKLVLRRIMHELGLGETAQRIKRAAQFGSRMAKLIRPQANGTDPYVVGETLLL